MLNFIDNQWEIEIFEPQNYLLDISWKSPGISFLRFGGHPEYSKVTIGLDLGFVYNLKNLCMQGIIYIWFLIYIGCSKSSIHLIEPIFGNLIFYFILIVYLFENECPPPQVPARRRCTWRPSRLPHPPLTPQGRTSWGGRGRSSCPATGGWF